MFYKYQKIYDNLDNYILDKKTNNKLFSKKIKWIVQEKVHGTNFSIYYDGKEIDIEMTGDTMGKEMYHFILESTVSDDEVSFDYTGDEFTTD